MNDSAIIPIQPVVVETDATPSESAASPEDQDKNTTLAKELAVLRSNIEYRVNQLQDLVEKEGAASERAQQLDRITAQMRESLNPDELLKIVVREIRSVLKTDRAIVCQLTPGFPPQKNRGKVIVESLESPRSSLLNAEIVDPRQARYTEQNRSGQVQAIANIDEAGLDERMIRQLKALQVKACLTVPIYSRNLNLDTEKQTREKQLYGLLIIHQCRQSNPVRHRNPSLRRSSVARLRNRTV